MPADIVNSARVLTGHMIDAVRFGPYPDPIGLQCIEALGEYDRGIWTILAVDAVGLDANGEEQSRRPIPRLESGPGLMAQLDGLLFPNEVLELRCLLQSWVSHYRLSAKLTFRAPTPEILPPPSHE